MEFILDEKGYHPGSNRTKPIKYIIENECWICISHSKWNSGYPHLGRNGKGYGIHRYVYELYKGNIPKNKVVMHSCDNPSCINPKHLSLGTQKQNIQDKVIKGRTNKGKKYTEEHKNKISNGHKKLKEEQVLEIKNMLLKNIKPKEIAIIFNVTYKTIINIKNGKSTYTKFLNGGLKEWLMEVK